VHRSVFGPESGRARFGVADEFAVVVGVVVRVLGNETKRVVVEPVREVRLLARDALGDRLAALLLHFGDPDVEGCRAVARRGQTFLRVAGGRLFGKRTFEICERPLRARLPPRARSETARLDG
jgi:hypothetical protein